MSELPGGDTDRPIAPAATLVEQLDEFGETDLEDLCAATVDAIRTGGGFGWVAPPPLRTLETYWRGVLLVPERQLFVGRLDGRIAGAVQLVRPARNNEAQTFSGQLVSCFVASWARGLGLANRLVAAVENAALAGEMQLINIDLRETQRPAIRLFEALGYQRWGEHPFYAKVAGRFVRGVHYYKFIDPVAEAAARASLTPEKPRRGGKPPADRQRRGATA